MLNCVSSDYVWSLPGLVPPFWGLSLKGCKQKSTAVVRTAYGYTLCCKYTNKWKHEKFKGRISCLYSSVSFAPFAGLVVTRDRQWCESEIICICVRTLRYFTFKGMFGSSCLSSWSPPFIRNQPFLSGGGTEKSLSVTSAMQKKREQASLQTRKGQKKRREHVGEGKEAKAHEYYNRGVFYIPSAFHRMIRTW